jgi:hypothetical protein
LNDNISRITARIASLEDELRTIAPHIHNAERIESRRRGVAILKDQVRRIEAMHDAWLFHHGTLLARCDEYRDMPRCR